MTWWKSHRISSSGSRVDSPRPVHFSGLNSQMPICAPTLSQTNAWPTAMERMKATKAKEARRLSGSLLSSNNAGEPAVSSHRVGSNRKPWRSQ